MLFRPRELVMRAREAATVLLRTLDQDEMVQRFLDIYAAENRRPGRADHPAHYREQLETIRREAILAMVLRVEAALPKRLNVRVPVRAARRKKQTKCERRGSGKQAARKTPGWEFDIPILDLFREEFFVALGQALHWTQQDADDFWRDLEVYEKLQPLNHRATNRNPRRATVASGPFADRVGFILDPSLIEQARRAANKFQGELDATADRILRNVLARRRPD